MPIQGLLTLEVLPAPPASLSCPFILAGEGEVTRLPHVSGHTEGVQALGASAAATPSGPKSHQAGMVPLRVMGYFQHRGEGARYLYCWDTQPERRPDVRAGQRPAEVGVQAQTGLDGVSPKFHKMSFERFRKPAE